QGHPPDAGPEAAVRSMARGLARELLPPWDPCQCGQPWTYRFWHPGEAAASRGGRADEGTDGLGQPDATDGRIDRDRQSDGVPRLRGNLHHRDRAGRGWRRIPALILEDHETRSLRSSSPVDSSLRRGVTSVPPPCRHRPRPPRGGPPGTTRFGHKRSPAPTVLERGFYHLRARRDSNPQPSDP